MRKLERMHTCAFRRWHADGVLRASHLPNRSVAAPTIVAHTNAGRVRRAGNRQSRGPPGLERFPVG